MSYVALVLTRLGGSGLALYKEHIALFLMVLPHPGSELSTVFFFYSLFFEEFGGKVSDIFSIIWTGWEPIQQVLLGSPIL